jgi:hypothetical protein
MKRTSKSHVKVSGMVAPEVHQQMAAVAKQARATIGAIVSQAVRVWLAAVAKDPDIAEALEPDARPETNRRLWVRPGQRRKGRAA